MMQRVQSLAAKLSGQFLSTTSFEKGNAMNTQNQFKSVVTLAAVATFLLTATSANAALVLTFTEEGSDVRLTYTGSVDLTNATFNGDAGYNLGSQGNEVQQNGVEWNPQGLGGVVGGDFYAGVDLLAVDLTNATFAGTADAGNTNIVFNIAGASFNIGPANNDDQPDYGVFAPSGFITFAGQSYASMGLDAHTPDVLTGLWAANGSATNNELVQFIVQSPPVPEPSTAILAGLGVVGLIGTRRRRRNRG
ncbi:MAG: PEP-CTERM sorting domain-containing protein [Pirellulales bacterium]|nr:PEP-CTERM sorting domain-containing protein [Pirellulales bacterium]